MEIIQYIFTCVNVDEVTKRKEKKNKRKLPY